MSYMDIPQNISIENWEVISFSVSGAFAAAAVLISLVLIWQHLRNWSRPDHQARIVRILIMVPIYAIDSWLSVRFVHYALYFDIARDCYEAYLLHQFFSLLIAYIEDEKPGKILEILETLPEHTHPFPLCCFSFQPGSMFLLVTRQCILQYVIIRPIMALASALMQILGVFHEGDFAFDSGYLYVTVINLTSVTVSMYCLVLFYLVTEKALAPYGVVSKLLSIKAILFFSFWQAVVIGILSYFSIIPALGHWDKKEVATALNDFIICFEMFFLAIVHAFVFPYQQYALNENAEPIRTPKQALKAVKVPMENFAKHVINQKDVVQDFTVAYDAKHVKAAKNRKRNQLLSQPELSSSSSSSDPDIDGMVFTNI